LVFCDKTLADLPRLLYGATMAASVDLAGPTPIGRQVLGHDEEDER
jgi:hypothetical protein